LSGVQSDGVEMNLPRYGLAMPSTEVVREVVGDDDPHLRFWIIQAVAATTEMATCIVWRSGGARGGATPRC